MRRGGCAGGCAGARATFGLGFGFGALLACSEGFFSGVVVTAGLAVATGVVI